MQKIKVYDEDMKKLFAVSTYDKFKGAKVEDIISWILNNDIISDEIHKKNVGAIPEWLKEAKCRECFKSREYQYGATDCTKCAYL